MTEARAMVHMTLSELEQPEASALVDFLTPVCKAFCTEAGSDGADLGIQVLGGYGNLSEYGVEQHWRDNRITQTYEGTNGIHADTLVSRLLRHDDGRAATAFDVFMSEELDDVAPDTARYASAAAFVCMYFPPEVVARADRLPLMINRERKP